LSVCKELHVPAKEKYAYLDSKKEFESEDEKLAHLQEMIAFVKNTYHEIPMEQFLAEVNESQDWDGLKYIDDLYWDNIENLLTDAVRLSAVNVIKLVAPHILFGNELLLKEYCEKAPDDAAREALEQSFIRRHDEDYENYPFSWVWNKREWNRKEDYGEIKLISLTDCAQENLWRAFLNEFALGSELLFYEHLTSRRVEGVKLDSERAGFRMRDLGYRITEDGFEKMPLPDYWIMKSVHHKPDDESFVS
jgi:hypothetical protein